ncbi:MAG: response regulator [Candidatus Omnitrophota bacterium]
MEEQRKILLIDDEKDFVELLRDQLSLQGYKVIAAFDGDEGLKKAKSENPDLIICDIRMPNKNGHEVLSELRKAIRKNTPFIMLSALNDLDNVMKSYDGDSDFYVPKPVQLESLFRNIKTLLNLSKNREDV